MSYKTFWRNFLEKSGLNPLKMYLITVIITLVLPGAKIWMKSRRIHEDLEILFDVFNEMFEPQQWNPVEKPRETQVEFIE